MSSPDVTLFLSTNRSLLLQLRSVQGGSKRFIVYSFNRAD